MNDEIDETTFEDALAAMAGIDKQPIPPQAYHTVLDVSEKVQKQAEAILKKERKREDQ